MWERFSYYGLRGLLTLYLTTALVSGGLGFSPAWALSIYGFYTGACYFTPMIGGYLTDRFLGRRKAITIGGITMAIGNLTLFALQNQLGLYLGLALLLSVTDSSNRTSLHWLENYTKRTIQNVIVHLPFSIWVLTSVHFSSTRLRILSENLFKTTVDGVVHYGFRYGFLAASIGMIIGQILFTTLSNRFLGNIGKTNSRFTNSCWTTISRRYTINKRKTTYRSYRHFNMLRCLLLGWL